MKKSTLFSLLICLFLNTLYSQNLLVNGDFESGGIGVGFNINSSGYNFVSVPSGVTAAGDYAFGTNPFAYNNSNFITGTDHTTATGIGKMMIVDGSTDGGNPSFWKAGNTGGGACGLTVGATYTFTYWVKSISNNVVGVSSQADIRAVFNNATVLTSPTSTLAPLPGVGWQLKTYTFTPTNACVNIELRNFNINAVGNDFAIDDLSLVPPAQPLAVSYSVQNASCPGFNDGSIAVYASGGTGSYTSYSISTLPIQTNATGLFINLAPGTYSVSVTDSSTAQVSQNNITVGSPPNPLTVSSTAATICIGGTSTLSVSGGSSYLWTSSPNDSSLTTPAISNPIVSPAVTTTYTVTSSIVSPRNLIFNGNFSQGNLGFFTDYQYLSTATGFQKAYGIVTQPNLWYSTFSNCTDHTSGTGNMMVVDGSNLNAGNDKLWCQTVAVIPNQNHTLSYWIQTVATPNPASIDVVINGVSQGIGTAPAVATCGNWTQYTYVWNSGINTSAQICLYDRNVSVSGNDFAIDDISFTTSTTCSVSKSITITVNPRPTFNLSNVIGCVGGTVPLSATNISSGTSNYSWTVPTGAANPGNVATFNASIAGNYTLVTTNSTTGCSSLPITVSVTLNPVPTVVMTGNTTICAGNTTTISFNGTPNAQVQFTSSTGSQYSVTLDATGNAIFTTPILNLTTIYTLYDISLNGCTKLITGPVVTITVRTNPFATMQASTLNECQNYTPLPVITFTGSNGVAPYTFSYTINGGAVQTVSTTLGNVATVSVPTNVAGAFTYTLVGVRDSGTVFCSQTLNSSVTVNINASPLVTLSAGASICPNTSTSITITGPPNATVILISDTGSNYPITLNAAGTGVLTTPVLSSTTIYTVASVNGNPVNCTISRTVFLSENGCIDIDAGNSAYTNSISAICNVGECRDLFATFQNLGNTTQYSVSSIPYCPQAAFSGAGFTSVSVNTDDVWSGPITIPFNFCFFGTNYNYMNVGSNGLVAFNTNAANSGCPWAYTQTVPNAAFPIRNAIYGVYQDIDPSVTPTTGIANVNYKIDVSNPNCRKIIINFSNVPQFSCLNNVGTQTSQIVMYETSNIVEVYVQRRTTCAGWNGGRGTIGIQNNAGTLGYTAPGRNASQWTATNEAWRFTPSGPSVVNFQWLVGTTPISTNTNITVCPTATTTYTAQAQYFSCGVLVKTVSKDVSVEVFPDNLQTPINLTNCITNNVFNLDSVIPSLLGSLDPNNYEIAFHTSYSDALLVSNPISNSGAFTSNGQTIYISIQDLFTG
jgi:hypothetical protein